MWGAMLVARVCLHAEGSIHLPFRAQTHTKPVCTEPSDWHITWPRSSGHGNAPTHLRATAFTAHRKHTLKTLDVPSHAVSWEMSFDREAVHILFSSTLTLCWGLSTYEYQLVIVTNAQLQQHKRRKKEMRNSRLSQKSCGCFAHLWTIMHPEWTSPQPQSGPLKWQHSTVISKSPLFLENVLKYVTWQCFMAVCFPPS